MVRCAPLLASISRSLGRRFAGAVTLALALSVSFGGVAIAAPPPPPPPPPAPSAPATDPAAAPVAAADPAVAAPTPAATTPPPTDPKAAKQAWKAAKKAEKQAKKAERRAKKQAKKAAKQAAKQAKNGKQGTPSTTGATTATTPTPAGAATTPAPTGAATTPAPTGATTTPAPTGVATTTAPDPTGTTTAPPPTPTGTNEPATGAGLTAILPVQVEGSLSKDSRRTLGDRFQSAAAAAQVTGGPYRVSLKLRVSKKKKKKKTTTSYALALTVLGADDATLAAPTDECKGCSIAEVGAKIDALVQQAASGLAPKEPPPPVIAEVSVRTDPLGARVRVDGAEHGLTPQVLELLPGEHTIAVDKPGFLPQEQKLMVEAGAPQQLDVKLVAEAPAKRSKRAKEPKESTVPADPSAGRGLKIGGAVMLGLGVVGVVTGVAMILIDEEPKPLDCSGADVDFRGVCRNRYDTLLGGIVGVAAGGLGIGGGVAMMIQGRRVSMRARAGRQQVSLGLVVRF